MTPMQAESTKPSPPAGAEPSRWLLAAILIPVLLATALAATLASGFAAGPAPLLALTFPILLVPVLVWRRPELGVYIVFAIAVTIEQFGYTVGPRGGAVTASVPLFTGILPGGMNPVELLLAITLLATVAAAVKRNRRILQPSRIGLWLVAVLGLVGLYLGYGLARGGNLTMALWEVRPFLYLAAGFFLASTLLTTLHKVRPLLWILVIGAGFKACYGFLIFLSIRDLSPRPEAVLAHEASFFFGAFVLATVGMWLFGIRGSLRTVATILLPVVLVADMVNSRRTAWLILFSGLAVLCVLAFARIERRRPAFIVVAVIVGILGSGYLAAFWEQNGTVAQPARAIRSVIAPDPRDEASNDYRDGEDVNLIYHIKQSKSLGLGFGHPVQYSGIVDLTEDNPFLAYVPHNGVLYLWLRMGAVGLVVYLLFLSQIVITSVRFSRAPVSRETKFFAAFVAAVVLGFAAMGVTDLGFAWFRNTIAMGILTGALVGLNRTFQAQQLWAIDVAASAPPTQASLGRTS